MRDLKRQLTLRNGIPLGIGSIAGSGILFLPSLTYSISGTNIAYVWALSVLLCIPLLVIFTEMVKRAPNSSGIENIISIGLGDEAGFGMVLLMLSAVMLGIPLAGIIAGKYVSYLFEDSVMVKTFVAVGTVAVGVVANLLNIKINSKVQGIVAFFLILFGLILVFFSTQEASAGYHRLITWPEASLIAPGIMAAFWAFVGFENLTFIAGEFKNPVRDFHLSMVIAIVFCGLLYFFLGINFAALTDRGEIDTIVGLYQLTNKGNFFDSFNYLLGAFAIFSVLLSLISWVYGISRLLYSSSQKGKFFPYFARLNKNGVPGRSILLLSALFPMILILDAMFPRFIDQALIVASTNFVAVYLLCIGSYLKIADVWWKKLLAILLLMTFGFSALTSGIKLLYSIAVYGIAVVWYRYRTPLVLDVKQ